MYTTEMKRDVLFVPYYIELSLKDDSGIEIGITITLYGTEFSYRASRLAFQTRGDTNYETIEGCVCID